MDIPAAVALVEQTIKELDRHGVRVGYYVPTNPAGDPSRGTTKVWVDDRMKEIRDLLVDDVDE